jgi:hypothetical protein
MSGLVQSIAHDIEQFL